MHNNPAGGSRLLRRLLVLVLFLSSAMVPSLVASAQQAERDPVDEQAVLDRVTLASPDAVSAFMTATRMYDSGDFEGATAQFTIALGLAPQQPDILRRLAWSRLSAGDTANAKMYAEQAVTAERSADNLFALGLTTWGLVPPGEEASQDWMLESANGYLFEALSLTPVSDAADRVELMGALSSLAQARGDLPGAIVWARQAVDVKPNDSASLSWLGSLLIQNGDEREGNEVVALARTNGATDASLLEFGLRRRTTADDIAPAKPYIYGLGIVLAVVLGLSAILLFAGEIQSRRNEAFLNRPIDGKAIEEEARSRGRHKVLVRAASLLYLLFLPLVIVFSLVVTLMFIVVCLIGRRIPIGVIGSTFTGLSRTILVLLQRARARVTPPTFAETGRLVAPAEAPRLFTALDVVAKLANAPVPDEVRMVPGATVSVHERTDEKTTTTVRVLTVGAAALQDLELQSFLAILAHELGHLRGGDTSGGVHAIRVSNNMLHLSHSLPDGLYSVLVCELLKPVWWMHHRITRSAQRFQEVLADRVAVAAFGAKSFEDGLTQVVVNGVVFNALVAITVNDPKQQTYSVYDESRLTGDQLDKLEARAKEALSRKTTKYDSHPSPVDRFRYAKLVTSPATQNVPGSAWSLFVNPDGLRKEMDAQTRTEYGIGPVEIAPVYTYAREQSVPDVDEYVETLPMQPTSVSGPVPAAPHSHQSSPQWERVGAAATSSAEQPVWVSASR
jgi:tetratricopeptide (TPR) repeat protein